jgi:hypothetical protein
MKKLLSFIITTTVLFTFTACGSSSQNKSSMPSSKSQNSTPPDTSTSSNTDEKQILAVYERMQQAMVDKDIDTLREMMGANTTVRHITGRTQTMDEWLSDVKNEKMKYYSIKVTKPKIVIKGDTATLTCSNVIDARIYGSRGTWTLSGGANFEKINSKWLMAHPT